MHRLPSSTLPLPTFSTTASRVRGLIDACEMIVNSGKPEGIHLMIGRWPYAAFGSSTGDRQMLEYTKAGEGVRLANLISDASQNLLIPGRARAGHSGR